jgi:hypothetical protein
MSEPLSRQVGAAKPSDWTKRTQKFRYRQVRNAPSRSSLGPDLSLGTLRGDHLDRRYLHRVSLILSRDSDASDFDFMAEVRSEVRCRLRNDDFFRPFLQIRELEGSVVVSLRQTPGHAVLGGRTLGLGAKSETN